MSLTKSQRQAVESKKYPCFLLAGAGTGKTKVLVDKVGHLIANESESLEHICVVTFTNKATDELKERLYKDLYNRWLSAQKNGDDTVQAERLRMQAEMCPMAQISTIHEFCDRLLRTYGTAIGISPAFRIVSDKGQTQKIIDEVYNKYRDNSALTGIRQYKVTELIALLINSNNNRGITLDVAMAENFDFSNDNNAFFNNFKKVFIQIYLEAFERIEREKLNKNIFTLNDTIRKTAELLQNPDIAKRIAAQLHYLFIDEFQDVDYRQFQIVSSLIKTGTKVFIVGDEKQSIFRFRGADVQNVSVMKNDMAGFKMEVMEIAENFRSDASLIDIFNCVFQHPYSFGGEPIYFPKNPLIAPNKTNANAVSKPFEMIFGEDIVSVVRRTLQREKLYGNTINCGDIAILCRNNADIDKIAFSLKSNGIPAEVFGGKGFYKSSEIIDVYKLLNAAIHKSEDTLEELMFTDYFHALGKNSNELRIENFLAKLRTILRQSTVDNALLYSFEKSGILDYYRSKGRYQAVSNLNKLKNIAKEKMDTEWLHPIGFLDFLEIMLKSKHEEDEADIHISEQAEGVVTVCTVHKAKGLSFPIVIIVGCDKPLIRSVHSPKIIFNSKFNAPKLAFDNGTLGNNIKEIDKDYQDLLNNELIATLEEELRILYVALTRAKHKVIALTERKTLEDGNVSWAKWLLESLRDMN